MKKAAKRLCGGVLAKSLFSNFLVLALICAVVPLVKTTVNAEELFVNIDPDSEVATSYSEGPITISGTRGDSDGFYCFIREGVDCTFTITAKPGFTITKVTTIVGWKHNDANPNLEVTVGSLPSTYGTDVGEVITITDINSSSITFSNSDTYHWQLDNFTVYYKSNHTHTYSDWYSNETSHWKTCTASGCTDASGTKYQEALHTPGPAATDTTPQTCTICSYIINPATGGGSQGGLNYDKSKESYNFARAGLNNTTEQLRERVLSENEKSMIKEGATINIWLDVKKQEEKYISAPVLEKLKKSVPGGYVYTSDGLLDINLWKQILNSDGRELSKGTVPNTNGKVSITIKVPTNLQKAGRAYNIVRIHDEKAESLPTKQDANYNVTFETDGFSTYAIAYSDATPSVASASGMSPKTGESSTPYAWLILLMASLGVLMIATRKKDA